MANRYGNMETATYFIILDSKIPADGDCSREIKRCLLFGRKAITKLKKKKKSREITLPTKVHLVKATVFPIGRYGYERWTTMKADHQRTDVSELWCWRILLRVSWTAKTSTQSTVKEINPEYLLEELMLKQKLQYFGYLMQGNNSLENTLMLGKIEGGKDVMTEDERVGWHHQLNGHEFEQAPGVSDGQGSLAYCSPWGHKESDTIEKLN